MLPFAASAAALLGLPVLGVLDSSGTGFWLGTPSKEGITAPLTGGELLGELGGEFISWLI